MLQIDSKTLKNPLLNIKRAFQISKLQVMILGCLCVFL